MDSNIKISLVMIVKNEEKVLARCLESVKELVDEMVIVDTGSKDRTIEIAKSFGAKIYHYQWQNDFGAARNFALDQATTKWRLVLDADEYLVQGNRKEIEEVLNNHCVGMIERIDGFYQDEELKYARSFITRLIPEGTKYEGKIHEQVKTSLPFVKLPLQFEHDGYLHQDKSERNLKLLFDVVEKRPDDSYMLYQLAHTLFLAKREKESIQYYHTFYAICNDVNSNYRASAIVDYLYNIVEVKEWEIGLEVIQHEETRYSDYADFTNVCAHFYRELILSDIKKYIKYLPLIEEYYIKSLENGESIKYDSVEGAGSYLAAYNLGVWYEVTKQFDKALTCYDMAVEWGYEKAAERKKMLEA